MITTQEILADVALIRLEAAAFLVDTCIRRRKTGETLSYGAAVPIYEEVELPCRFIIKSGDSNENIAAQERAASIKKYIGNERLQVPIDADVIESDIIEYTDRLGKESTYEVVYVPTNQEMTGALVIILKKIK